MRFCRPNLCVVLVLCALSLSISGCGRRGPLEPPPGAAATNAPLTGTPDEVLTPKTYTLPPAQGAAAAGESQPTNKTTPAQPSTASAPAPAAAPAPPRPFFLDPLL